MKMRLNIQKRILERIIILFHFNKKTKNLTIYNKQKNINSGGKLNDNKNMTTKKYLERLDIKTEKNPKTREEVEETFGY